MFSILLMVSINAAKAQIGFKWPDGKKAAVVLSYDDALQSQLSTAAPQLSKYGLKGTFFLDGRFTEEDMDRWLKVSLQGNELANHSIYHPCSQKAYKATNYSENYTVDAMVKEIGMMNKMLHGIDGRKTRSYAYPCGASLAGTEDYTEQLKKSGYIKYARAGSDRDHTIVTDFKAMDYFKVPAWGVAANTEGSALVDLVKDTQQAMGMAVFMFHGVGGDYLDVSAQAHEQLLQYLSVHRDDIWIGTFQEVLDYIKKQN
jgi:peptidoglycan/xylan/chitin deacetylase (PgdA/CDA1 family)